jgi:hypothetical protein
LLKVKYWHRIGASAETNTVPTVAVVAGAGDRWRRIRAVTAM